MSLLTCHDLAPDLDELAAGGVPTSAQRVHLDTCADCRAGLLLAQRIDRVLDSWPTPAPPPHFAVAVAAAARRETWRHEQVFDWSFNAALAVALATMAAGVAGAVWVIGATSLAGGANELAGTAVASALAAARAQAPVLGTATLLLATTLGAWWWAEERARW